MKTRRTGALGLLLAGCIASATFAGGAAAQQIEMSSTLNPVGSGARATGMGGAFIGVADDATAASWNPAGLVQLEKPEVSIAYAYFSRTQDYNSAAHPEIEGENAMDVSGVNYLSIAYPFTLLKRNMIVSLNYQRLYEMTKDLQFDYTWDNGIVDAIGFKQDGFLYTISPAFAVQVTPTVQVGATLNVWDDLLGANGWENTYRSSGSGTLFGYALENSFEQNNEVSFRGVNGHLGLMWNAYGPFTLGAVYKTAFDADLSKETTTTISQDVPEVGLHDETSDSSSEDLTMKMPASYGLGLSYRSSDRWTVVLDAYRTEWSRFVIIDGQGVETNPLDSRPVSEGRLEDTTQVRLGTEYLFIGEKQVVPVRFGVFYDPEPAKGDVDAFYGFALGSGYSNGRISLDASYQYRVGTGVSGDIPAVAGSSADIRQHTVMVSLICYLR
jgi:long-subunit fatty acid transport protein